MRHPAPACRAAGCPGPDPDGDRPEPDPDAGHPGRAPDAARAAQEPTNTDCCRRAGSSDPDAGPSHRGAGHPVPEHRDVAAADPGAPRSASGAARPVRAPSSRLPRWTPRRRVPPVRIPEQRRAWPPGTASDVPRVPASRPVPRWSAGRWPHGRFPEPLRPGRAREPADGDPDAGRLLRASRPDGPTRTGRGVIPTCCRSRGLISLRTTHAVDARRELPPSRTPTSQTRPAP